MASIADDRLEALAALVEARGRSRPRRSASSTCPAPGRRCSAGCARSTRSSPSRTASRPVPIPAATWRRSSSSCSSPTATTSSGGSSGSRSRRSRATRRCARRSSSCRRCSRTSRRATALRDFAGELPAELEPLTTKPLLARRERAGRDRPAARGRARGDVRRRRRRSTGRRGPSALDEVVRRLRDALDLITFFTAGEKETRAWTLRRGQTALEAAASIHSDIARGFIRCETILTQTCSRPARTPRRRSAARSGSRERPTRSRTATS